MATRIQEAKKDARGGLVFNTLQTLAAQHFGNSWDLRSPFPQTPSANYQRATVITVNLKATEKRFSNWIGRKHSLLGARLALAMTNPIRLSSYQNAQDHQRQSRAEEAPLRMEKFRGTLKCLQRN